MNKPLVAVLVSLIALGTVNFVMAAAPGTIQNVFVTNWPRNTNVTVTNPPTVFVNNTVTLLPRAPLDKGMTGTVTSIQYGFTRGYVYVYLSDLVDYAPADRWPTNYTFDVTGYQTLSLAAFVHVPSDHLVNQSSPITTSQGTITYFNVTTVQVNVDYSFPGHSPIIVGLGDSQSPPGTDPSGDSTVQVFAGIVPSRGPLVTVHIYYYSLLVSGWVYGNCFYLLSGGCTSNTSGQITGVTLLSSTTQAKVTVYSTG